MGFKFAFETLLKVRKRKEEELRRIYLEAQHKADDCLEVINKLFKQIDKTRELSKENQEKGGGMGPILESYDNFIKGQNVIIEQQKEKARELLADAEQKREAFVEAAKERKVLDHLKEKKEKEHKNFLKKKEAKEMDDLILMRSKRGSR